MTELNKLYDDVIMDHIKHARNYRELDAADRRAEGFNPLCGDTLTVFVKLDRDRIEDASFQCSCCGISMASASIMTENVKGKSIAEARAVIRDLTGLLTGTDGSAVRESHLAVLNVVRDFPSRVDCALLAWQTLAAALQGNNERRSADS